MKIALLGDIAFFGKYSSEKSEIFPYFKTMADKLKEFDYVIGNLETPFINGGKPHGSKSAYIKSREENVALLKYLNINIVNLSNNHIFDYGLDGYEKTKEILDKNEIKYFGIENKTVFIEKDITKLAFTGYCCYSTNALGYYDKNKKVGINTLDAYKVEEELIKNHNEGYLNIISFHVGQEQVNYPNFDHIEMARIFAKKVPYIYYGHHPHVIQGIERVDNSLIAYSLGNFCFDDVYTSKSKEALIKQSDENKKSFILSLEIEKNELINYKIIPFLLNNNGIDFNIPEILDEINRYSKFLKLEKKHYICLRDQKRNKYLTIRKSMRNMEWYIKRLNFKSVRIIINARNNKKLYNECITKYINSNLV